MYFGMLFLKINVKHRLFVALLFQKEDGKLFRSKSVGYCGENVRAVSVNICANAFFLLNLGHNVSVKNQIS